MRRLQLFTFLVPLLAALACNDAISPPKAVGPAIRAPQRTLVIPSTTPQVSAGGAHTCALKTDGTVVCWGYNFSGQTTVPAGLASVAELSSGVAHTCALKTDGMVICWGENGSGQTDVPAGLTSVAQVSNGADHTCALRIEGTVVCWGLNNVGQVTVPEGLASVAQVSAGGFHNCAVKIDATVVCWGANNYGQATVPAGLSSAAQVSTGYYHTCALKTDGTLVCWAYSFYGEATVPSGLSSVTQLSAGNDQTCALKADATVICWGYNYFGEATVPAGLASVAQVSNYGRHTCALKTDGTVVCWGQNGEGQATVPTGLNLITSPPGTTPVGSNVPVTPLDQTTGQLAPVTVSFGTVTASGTTTLTSSSNGGPPPPGFKLGTPPTYYELQTTASFSGVVTVCFNYSGVSYQAATNLRLFHGGTAGWTDVTTSLSTSTSTICGTVTSLSPFILAELRYDFTGFFQPVDNPTGSPPPVNVVNAGSAIPVKFSLGSDLGLDILASRSPASSSYTCTTSPEDAIEQTVTASSSGLKYDPVAGQYTYVWKTDKLWASSCRRFALTLKDGTVHEALFHFTK